MSWQWNSRFPIFELGMLLLVLGLGWAVFRTYQTLREPEPQPVPTVESLAPAQALDMQGVFKLHDLEDLANRWLELADQLQSGVLELRGALETFIRSRDRTAIAKYLEKSQALQRWMSRQQETVDRRKSQGLTEWLRAQPGVVDEFSPLIRLDFENRLHAAGRMLSNLVATVGISEGQSRTPELVQKRLSSASIPEQALLALADEARNQAKSMEAYVARRSAELAGTNSSAQAVTRVASELKDPAVSERGDSLQSVFYGLIVALVIQCGLLTAAFSRRAIIMPLRNQLAETHRQHERKLEHFARLATGLAHEIRNPLTAISVRLFTLQKKLTTGTPEHGDAKLIRSEIDRLDQIVKNFLKLARPADSKLAPMRPLPLLREVHELLAPQLQQQHISMKCEESADEPFEGDPAQLKQVLINLVQNAAESIGQDGSVTLRARVGEAKINEKRTPAVILEVEDDGAGITPEVQERLFDPFFSTKEYGTGLGLPIAARIIDQHHGKLDFETQVGRGTVFRVLLPAASDHQSTT